MSRTGCSGPMTGWMVVDAGWSHRIAKNSHPSVHRRTPNTRRAVATPRSAEFGRRIGNMDHLRAVPGGADEVWSGGAGVVDVAADLKAASRGDQQAFARVYDATSAKMYGLVLRVLRNPAMAEEVTQECFLEIWRQSARYEAERGSALAWMLTIAHRRAVDRVRAVEASDRRDVHYEQSARV